MAIHSRLQNLRRAILSLHHPKTATAAPVKIQILAFEVASILYKLLQILHHLSASQLSCRRHLSSLAGAAAIFSGDADSLLWSARAELILSIRFVGESISLLAAKCSNPSLLQYKQLFTQFADLGFDPHHWVLNPKEVEKTLKKVTCYLSATSSLYLEMEKFRESEKMLKNLVEDDSGKTMIISNLKKTLILKNQDIEHLKRTSLWRFSFDEATLLLAKLSFTALFRLKGTLMREEDDTLFISPKDPSLPSCNCFSSTIHPSSPERLTGFFSESSGLLLPRRGTLGAASLHLHYATIIVHAEKFLKYPCLIREGERDELYSMLPERLRKMVRAKLREEGRCFNGERKAGLLRTMALLSPLARNTLRWQEERSFGKWRSYSVLGESTLVLLPQTLFFAEREKIEKSMVDMLVDLTMMWRLAMEMRERSVKP